MSEAADLYLRAIRELRDDNQALRQDIRHLTSRVGTLEAGFKFVQDQYGTIIEILTDMKAGQDEIRRRLGLIDEPT